MVFLSLFLYLDEIVELPGYFECNQHLLRDLLKVQDNLGHKWPQHLAKLLTDTFKCPEL